MDLDQTRGVAFLLSLAVVPLTACPAPSDGTTGGGTDDTNSDTSNTGAATEQTSATTTTATADDSSSDAGSATSETTTTETTETTSDPASICPDFEEHIFDCVPDASSYYDRGFYVTYCTDKIAMYTKYSQDCGAAAEELFACIGAAPCSDLLDMTSCPEENEALDLACGMDGGSGG